MENNIKGFKFAGINGGLKKSGKKDIALIYSEKPCNIAATFTKNEIIAEPLKLDKKHAKNGKGQAIVINSGNANACTGKQGYEGALAMAQKGADLFGIKEEDVFVLSTGIIGRTFPTDQVTKGMEKCHQQLGPDADSRTNAAEAIITTDTFPKQYQKSIEIDGKTVELYGMSKGSGMIHPNMGTMLAFLTCDIDISGELLQEAFKETVDRSFNMISIDGDTSTNDTALIMCNGEAGNKKISSFSDPDYHIFKDALHDVCKELAMLIVKDGEGVSKFIEYKVINAKSEKEARQIIRTISDSSLVKTAMFGEDPNWGRIIAAAGRAGVPIDADKTDLYIGNIQLLKNGQPLDQNIPEAEKTLHQSSVYITINLNQGDEAAVGWGSDLSLEYVRFNSAYTT